MLLPSPKLSNQPHPQARLLSTFTSQPSYTDAAANADFALVTLTKPVGDTTGWMGLEYPASGSETVDLTTTGGLSRQSLIGRTQKRPADTPCQMSHVRRSALSKDEHVANLV